MTSYAQPLWLCICQYVSSKTMVEIVKTVYCDITAYSQSHYFNENNGMRSNPIALLGILLNNK